MTLLEKHRKDYKTLRKKDLILIIEEQLKRNALKNSHVKYNPLNSVWNNNRRGIRRDWNRRHEPKVRERIRNKIKILRGIKKEDRRLPYVKTDSES